MPPPLLGHPVLPHHQPLPRGQGPPCHARPTGKRSEFKVLHVHVCIVYMYINYVTWQSRIETEYCYVAYLMHITVLYVLSAPSLKLLYH